MFEIFGPLLLVLVLMLVRRKYREGELFRCDHVGELLHKLALPKQGG